MRSSSRRAKKAPPTRSRKPWPATSPSCRWPWPTCRSVSRASPGARCPPTRPRRRSPRRSSGASVETKGGQGVGGKPRASSTSACSRTASSTSTGQCSRARPGISPRYSHMRNMPKTLGALRVLMITSEWPTDSRHTAHFIARQVRFLRAAGVDVDVFQFRGSKRPLRYLAAWARLRIRMWLRRYDLIHAQSGQTGVLAFPTRLPLVVTFRGSDVFGIIGRDGRPTWAGRLLQSLSRRVARRADAPILVSEHLKEHLPHAGRMHIVPSGLDLALFRCIPRDEARRHPGWPTGGRRGLVWGDPAHP